MRIVKALFTRDGVLASLIPLLARQPRTTPAAVDVAGEVSLRSSPAVAATAVAIGCPRLDVVAIARALLAKLRDLIFDGIATVCLTESPRTLDRRARVLVGWG